MGPALGTVCLRYPAARLRLKDESLEDSANLPDPDIIAAEIVEDLQAALAQFAEIASDSENAMHTAHSQPIMGTPCDVPVPRKVKVRIALPAGARAGSMLRL